MDRPVVLCGLGKVGWRVLEFLRGAALPVVVVDLHCPPDDPRLAGCRAVRGDFREPAVLQQAGVANARGVLILTSDDLVNIAAALAIRRLHPDMRIVVRMFNQNLLARLGKAVGNTHALSVSALTAPLLALTALTGEVLGAFSAGVERRHVAKLGVAVDSPLVGRRLADVAQEFRLLVLAHNRVARKSHRVLLEVDGNDVVQADDELTLCGEPNDLARLLPLGQAHEWEGILPGVRWAGRVRRFGRVFWRALAEIDLALKICTLVLVIVVAVSTIIYSTSGMSTSVPDGLYRTISVIATGADMKADHYEGWQKVFVSALRVCGAVLTAAFTAIFTNYLLRARLGGALEVRRIPDGGHVVVCGLGNVGFRVVEELLKCDERVVVIERSRDNPFIGTCRRLGAAVIVGDATVLEVLRQARAGSSRAVVAASSNDLINLEIALLVRELNPKQRVVVRLVDDTLAETLREVVDVRLALSLPTLAAPAFVAALYGDRVHSLFRMNQQMFAAVEFAVQPHDPCLDGQSLRAVALDYRLVPVGNGDPARRLREGDQLTVIAALPDLERLFRREPAPAEWLVELTSLPITARGPIALIIRTENGLTAEAANAALETLPLRVGARRTRGQAEELQTLFGREKATATIVKA